MNYYGQIILTANTLYDAVEPKAIWKPLYVSVKDEITSGGSRRDAIDMVLFILRTFHSEDEEIRSVHLPLVFSALVENLEVSLKHLAVFPVLTLFRSSLHGHSPRKSEAVPSKLLWSSYLRFYSTSP